MTSIVTSDDTNNAPVAKVLVATPLGGLVEAPAVVIVDANGEALGGGSGIVATASFTPTASAYLANDVFDTAKEFAFTYAQGGQAVLAGSLIRITTAITRIDATALQASEGAYQLRCFSTSAGLTTLVDNDPFTLNSADLAPYRGIIPLGTPSDEGGVLYNKSSNVDLDVRLGSTVSSLWARLQTVAGFTPTAVARQVTLYGFVI